MSLCASVYMYFVVTCWERADLLALVCGVYCEFVTFPLVSWVRCDTLVYTGHRKTLAKLSNNILIVLTDKENTSVTIFYKFTVVLKKIVYETRL